jgi:hypothetical protein
VCLKLGFDVRRVKLTRKHLGNTPEPRSRGGSMAPGAGPGAEFAPLVLRVEYSMRNPIDGVQFVVPTDAFPYVSLVYYAPDDAY